MRVYRIVLEVSHSIAPSSRIHLASHVVPRPFHFGTQLTRLWRLLTEPPLLTLSCFAVFAKSYKQKGQSSKRKERPSRTIAIYRPALPLCPCMIFTFLLSPATSSLSLPVCSHLSLFLCSPYSHLILTTLSSLPITFLSPSWSVLFYCLFNIPETIAQQLGTFA